MHDRKPGRHPVSNAFLLTQIGTRAAQAFGRLLTPLDVTPPDAGILRLLAVSPGLSQQELAQRLGMHASRLVAIIDALEQREFVARKPNPDDRRLYSLELTTAGKDAMAAIGRVAREHDDLICAQLNAKEREQLAGLLGRIADGLGLAPGIHPGYKTLDIAAAAERGRNPRNPDAPCE